MATEKEIKITADTSEADKDIKKLADTIDNLGKKSEETADNIKDVAKATEEGTKATKSLEGGFKGMGLAIKAAGIGLLIGLFNIFKELLNKNQKVVNIFNTAMTALSIIFNDVFEFVTSNFMPAFEKMKTFFDNLTFDKIGKAIKANITERFESLIAQVGFLADAFKKLFSGDFEGAWESAGNAAKEWVDVLTGIPNTVDSVTDAVGNGIDAVIKYGSETLKTADSMVTLKNNAILAAAEQQGLLEKYNIMAEKLRQVRDNDLISIDDRIKANDDLKKVLQDQEDALQRSVDIKIKAAQAEFDMNDSIENQVALKQALNEKIAVTAQIEGMRSENIAQTISLLKEKMALERSSSDATLEQQLEQMKFDAEQEVIESKKMEQLLITNKLEKDLISEQLQTKIDSYAEGTQAKIDAEAELTKFLQTNKNERITLEKQQTKAILDEAKKSKDKRIALEDAVRNAKHQMLSQTLDIGIKFAKKGSIVAKGLAVAQTTISTIQGAQEAFKTAAASPITTWFPAYPFIAKGLAYASGALSVKQILATDAISGGGSSLSGAGSAQSTPSVPSAPSFNLVQGTGTNQIAEGLQSGQAPIKAYVVSSDVSSSQEQDRKIIKGSSL